MAKKKYHKNVLKRTWHFIWEDNSIWSWIVNIILAFVLIKFIVYPGLGFLLQTSHPVVAVVSRSMEHNHMSFDEWWDSNDNWYLENNITKEDFIQFPSKNGFNKGDIFVLNGKKTSDIDIGDIMIFKSSKENPRPDPIIHRVIEINKNGNKTLFKTKGDNNPYPINMCSSTGCLYEDNINPEQVIGFSLVRIPYLGYIKIAFVCGIYELQDKDNFIRCLVA